MPLSSREALKALRAAGFVVVGQEGSHVQLKHPVRAGRVTVPHPRRELPVGTLASIERQSGIKLR
jgi:predicted RNA binding protein YcfA (HicA-like mRNA interferase family)